MMKGWCTCRAMHIYYNRPDVREAMHAAPIQSEAGIFLDLNPRIQLNYNDAIKSLVAAGYGATLLPHEASAVPSDVRITMRPLRPALWRELGIAHRAGHVERSTKHVLDVLWMLRAK